MLCLGTYKILESHLEVACQSSMNTACNCATKCIETDVQSHRDLWHIKSISWNFRKKHLQLLRNRAYMHKMTFYLDVLMLNTQNTRAILLFYIREFQKFKMLLVLKRHVGWMVVHCTAIYRNWNRAIYIMK